MSDVPQTDDRHPADMVTAMVDQALKLAETWTAWDGEARPINDLWGFIFLIWPVSCGFVARVWGGGFQAAWWYSLMMPPRTRLRRTSMLSVGTAAGV
jgi:hypothetical protein